MRLGICSIQRNRAPWIVEWIAFHYLMGFRNFYFFAHRCTDQTAQIISHLQRRIDIKAFIIPDDIDRPQLTAYQFAYSHFSDEVDWMAFIDGDEFLFPTTFEDIGEAVRGLDDGLISALGVYWSCFGSSGYLIEPQGLITENYHYRAPDDFTGNNHVKSIVRGGLANSVSVSSNAHIFHTPNGTFDENYRPITEGLSSYNPTWNHIRINHYQTQSLSFFKTFKQMSGAADGSSDLIRPDEWFVECDRNEILDNSLQRFLPRLRQLMSELCKQ